MKKTIKSLMALLTLAALASCGDANNPGSSGDSSITSSVLHQHNYNKEVISSEFLASAATCTAPSTYYYSCECGEKGTATFSFGGTNAANHSGQKVYEHTESGHEEVWNCCFQKAGLLEEHTYGADGVCTKCEYSHYNLTYTLNTEGTAYSVRALNPLITEAHIPATYKGIPVTSVEDKAFQNCEYLEKITIGSNVKSLGKYAFQNCSSLDNVVIPDNVTSFGQDLFHYCTSLTNVTLPSNLTKIYTSMFIYCKNLRHVEIPSTVTKIDKYAFAYCYNLQSITLPEGLTTISTDNTFKDCYSLREIQNLSKLTLTKGDPGYGEIASNALNIYDAAGTSILRTIGDYTFYIYENINYLLDYSGKEETITLPDVATAGSNYRIAKDAFAYDTIVKDLTITSAVSEISTYSFHYSSLESLTIVGKIPTFGDNVFEESTSLTTVDLSQSTITEIPKNTFNKCSSLSEVKFPSTLTKINVDAFKLTNLKNIVLPDSLVEIGQGAFYTNANSGVTETVVIGKNVTKIGREAFGGSDTAKPLTVYYKGSDSEWKNINIVTTRNGRLQDDSTKIYYYSKEKPMEKDNWHYVDDVPTLWTELETEPVALASFASMSGVAFPNSEKTVITKESENHYKITGEAASMNSEQETVWDGANSGALVGAKYVSLKVFHNGPSKVIMGWRTLENKDTSFTDSEIDGDLIKNGSISQVNKTYVLGISNSETEYRHTDKTCWRLELHYDAANGGTATTKVYTVDFSALYPSSK